MISAHTLGEGQRREQGAPVKRGEDPHAGYLRPSDGGGLLRGTRTELVKRRTSQQLANTSVSSRLG